jgi:hypothetical protein
VTGRSGWTWLLTGLAVAALVALWVVAIRVPSYVSESWMVACTRVLLIVLVPIAVTLLLLPLHLLRRWRLEEGRELLASGAFLLGIGHGLSSAAISQVHSGPGTLGQRLEQLHRVELVAPLLLGAAALALAAWLASLVRSRRGI